MFYLSGEVTMPISSFHPFEIRISCADVHLIDTKLL